MSETNRKLDKIAREEKWQMIGGIILLIPLVFVLVWFVVPNTGEVEEVQGMVMRLIGIPGEEGERLYLIVKLDNGEQVRSYIPTSAHFRKHGKVKLYKQAAVFFGRTVYRFGGYVDSDNQK